MTEKQSELPALIPVENITEVMQSAPAAVTENQKTVERSLEVAEKLIAEATEKGMSSELDAQIEKYLVKNRAAVETIYNRRTPITQLFNKVRDVFTGLENDISPKNKDSKPAKLQAIRDEYASKLIAIQRAKDEENRKRLEYDQAKINAKAECSQMYASHIIDYIVAAKAKVSNMMRLITEETTQKNFYELLESVPTMLPASAIFEFTYINAKISKNDLADIIATVQTEMNPKAKEDYLSDVSSVKAAAIEQFPGVLAELKERKEKLKLASEADQARLKKEQFEADEARKKQEEAEAFQAAQQAKLKASMEAESKKNVETATAMFDAHVESVGEKQVKAKVTLDIKVTSSAAFLNIVSLYFQLEGLKKTPEELEKITLGKMRQVCAKAATAGDNQLTNQGIEYFEVVKTSAR